MGVNRPNFFHRAVDQQPDADAQSSLSSMLNVLSDLVSWNVFTLRPRGCLQSRDKREKASRNITQSPDGSLSYPAT